ncbi:S41 family peptidase [Nisaea sediminum]|uniref:S41 family peptidase n=1 Tax=Nisaea sediminum TaxID=2775867 RepID=UPI001867E73A|nr:S41 family peptidase [Nisaea sediminum]
MNRKRDTNRDRQPRRRRLSRFVTAMLFSVLAACAAPRAPVDPMVYDRDAAAEVFSAGFEGITSFYIEETDLPSLVVTGLQGMRKLDDTVTVTDRGDQVIVGHKGRDVAAFTVPEPDDVARWSMLTAAVIDTGRRVSPVLHDAPPETLYNLVFRSALADLDRFSRYTTAADAARNRAHRRGYSGIGVVLAEKSGLIEIKEVFENGPAAHSGLSVGELILAIDDKAVAGLDMLAVSDLLRGPDGSVVRITTEAADRERTVSVTRAPVIEQTVYLKRIGDSAHLEIRSFNEATASSLRQKIAEAAARIGPSMNGIILDFRHNRGGVLRDAVSIADLFIEDGRILLTKGRHPRSEKEFKADRPDIAVGIPLIVLIDGDSASASEVVAGALQDSGRAVLIGSRTYGKGTVQMIVRLPNDGELIITWAKMYTPSGYPIGPFGVYPTICSAEIQDPELQFVGSQARVAAVRARELLRLRRIAHDLDESIQRALMERCSGRNPAAGSGDTDLALALRLLREPGQFERAFEASLIASKWPAAAQ